MYFFEFCLFFPILFFFQISGVFFRIIFLGLTDHGFIEVRIRSKWSVIFASQCCPCGPKGGSSLDLGTALNKGSLNKGSLNKGRVQQKSGENNSKSVFVMTPNPKLSP